MIKLRFSKLPQHRKFNYIPVYYNKEKEELHAHVNDIKREIKNSAEKNDIDIDIASNIKKEINKVTDNIEEYTQPVKKIKDTIIDDITGPIKRNK